MKTFPRGRFEVSAHTCGIAGCRQGRHLVVEAVVVLSRWLNSSIEKDCHDLLRIDCQIPRYGFEGSALWLGSFETP